MIKNISSAVFYVQSIVKHFPFLMEALTFCYTFFSLRFRYNKHLPKYQKVIYGIPLFSLMSSG